MEKEIQEILNRAVQQRLGEMTAVTDKQVWDIIDTVLLEYGRKHYIPVGDMQKLRNTVFHGIRGLDVLQELVDNPEITEIMINGPGKIFIERNGKLQPYEKEFSSREKLEDVIQQIVADANRIINEANPIVDVRLRDGSRVNVVLRPVALDGPVVTIRKFPERPITIDTLIALGSITAEAAEFLRKLVVAKYNIFISGGTGSGKTTFLNALSNFIPEDERIITIEDSAELQIQGISNLVRLETRNANVEGKNAISIRDLIKSSLRMRPDRIVVGEIRDAAAVDLLSAMNTGHDGSLSTGHANSSRDMLCRLETLVLMGMEIPLSAVRRQMASALDIIVHLGRLRDKSRKILEISEVLDLKDGEIVLQPLYVFAEEGEDAEGKIKGQLKRLPVPLENQWKLERAGIPLESIR